MENRWEILLPKWEQIKRDIQIDFDKSPIALKVKQQLSFITIPFCTRKCNGIKPPPPKKLTYKEEKKQFSKLED